MSAISRILIFLLFSAVTPSLAQNSSCLPSSCGGIRDIRFPFRLVGDPASCGYNDPVFALRCQNNRTTALIARSKTYHVLDINYDEFSIRLVDPGVNPSNLSSCPVHNTDTRDWPGTINSNFFIGNVRVVFIECSVPVTTRPDYIRAPLCSNRSTRTAVNSSSSVYSYAMVGEVDPLASELEESCNVDRVNWISTRRPTRDNGSLAGLYEGMSYGFELSWFRALCGECERTLGFCSLEGSRVSCRHYCREDTPISKQTFRCQFEYYGIFVGAYTLFAVPGLLVLRFLVGLPLLIWVVVYQWRRRHRFMDETTTKV